MSLNRLFVLLSVASTMTIVGATLHASAAPLIIDNGQPNAEIVISADVERPRMAAMGALELQHYLAKMSGARLPIVTTPGNAPVKIYVGRSAHTDRLGVRNDGLKYGAFRIVSGDDWLVLLGQDHDFTPPDPWSRGRKDIPRARAAWDAKVGDRTDAAWSYPFAGIYRHRWNPADYDEFMAARYGADNAHVWDPQDMDASSDYAGPGMGAGLWLHDWGGSLNAVYQFLRDLGVRWYMPGELGEVIPRQASIALPDVNATTHPDFPLRCWLGTRPHDFEGNMWKRRIGIESSFEVLGHGGTHGMAKVMRREEMKQAHPDYYALIAGYRVTAPGTGKAGEPCFSSEGLVEESAAYLSMRFGEYNEHMVQFSPPDGLRKCNCPECKDVPTSDLVFGFLDRVAQKLVADYPDHLVLGAAYTTYKDPPESIDRFSPNVAMTVNNCGRASFLDPERWDDYWKKIEGWRTKIAPGQLMRVENNRYEVHPPVALPVIHPHAMAKDLRALKGISLGDRNEISLGRKTVFAAPGCSHLTLYVNARFLWDADQDIDALLDEYYPTFYGPAADTMRAAFEYSEAHGPRRWMPGKLERSLKFITLLHEALAMVPPESAYAGRIQTIIDEVIPLQQAQQAVEERKKMGDPRKNNPVAVGHMLPAKGEVNTYSMKHLKTGEEPEIDTTFTVGWDAEQRHLVFDIRCEDPDMENLMVADNVWLGDSVAILLEPPNHSYYQLEINPDGTIFDADRFARRLKTNWRSEAQVTTEKGDDHWRVKVRIPVVSVEDGREDPNHFVVGPKPTAENPWHFNVCRARLRGRNFDKTAYAFSPTGKSYHVPEKFAKLRIE